MNEYKESTEDGRYLASKCHPGEGTCAFLTRDGRVLIKCSECHESVITFCLCCQSDLVQKIFEGAIEELDDGLVRLRINEQSTPSN